MEGIIFKLISQEEIHTIKPLWQELNELHHSKTHYFADHYENFTFETRMASLLNNDKLSLHIDVAVDADSNKNIGYCLSSINREHEGEVDSLYIKREYRGKKIGDALMKHALQWMDNEKVNSKKITVAEGNEEAFNFYMKYGFYPRLTTLIAK